MCETRAEPEKILASNGGLNVIDALRCVLKRRSNWTRVANGIHSDQLELSIVTARENVKSRLVIFDKIFREVSFKVPENLMRDFI